MATKERPGDNHQVPEVLEPVLEPTEEAVVSVGREVHREAQMGDTQAAATLPVVSKTEERALLREGAHKWSKAEVLALKEYCCPKDATPSEILSFWFVCKRTGLDPFARQIYLVRYGSGEEGEEGRGRCTIQVGIDGFRQVSMDAPGFAGIDEPKFEGEGTALGPDGEIKHPLVARVTVYRLMNGERVGFVGVARWPEFAKTVKDKATGKKRLRVMWATMPYNMLGKCAEVQAHRKSAPMRLSGVYAPEEIGTVIDVVGVVQGAPAMPRALGAPGQPAAPAKGGAAAQALWNKLMDMVGGDRQQAESELQRLTTFTGKDGKTVVGIKDWTRLSDGWAQKTLERLNKELEAGPTKFE